MPVLSNRVRWALGIAGLVVFVIFIEFYLGWLQLLAPWREIFGPLLVLVVGMVLGSYLIRTLRLYDYFRDAMRGGFLLAFKLILQHNIANNLLPMRTGEVTFPVLMSSYFRVRLSRSIPALLWFRILDLHTLGLLALFAVGGRWVNGYPLALLVLAWLSVPWVIYRMNHWLSGMLESEPQGRFALVLKKILDGAPSSLGLLLRTWIWTMLNWTVKIAAFAWLLMLFSGVPLAPAVFGVIGGELSSVLPVHAVAGVGTYEVGIVAALLPFGVEAENAVASAVNVHLFLLGVSLLGGALSLLLHREK